MTCLSIMLRKMLNRVGARTQPSFTPLTIGNDPEKSLFILTWLHWSCWGTLGSSQGAPWSSTVLFFSLCQTLRSGRQTLRTVPCSAPCISLDAVWGWTPCLWCPCWLWTHTVFCRWSLAIVGTNLFRNTRVRIVPVMENSDPPIFGAIWFFSLVQGDDDCIAGITCKFILFPTTDKEFVELIV